VILSADDPMCTESLVHPVHGQATANRDRPATRTHQRFAYTLAGV
jgi:hypothetical protein